MVRETSTREQVRLVDTPLGQIRYTLRQKKVRRLTLRVDPTGAAILTTPLSCPLRRADQFVAEKSPWLLRAARQQRDMAAPLLPPVSREDCLALLREALDQVYPLVAPLGVVYPQLKVRRMKTQWGNCHYHQGYITLNTALGRCPPELRRYVALHELVHFLHPNHGPGFRAMMDRLMPDWPARRQELRRYAAALDPQA